MPRTAVVLYREEDGSCPFLEWIAALPAKTKDKRKILELRTKAGLTQAQLGKLTGTTAPVICRLEDADYEGHSLAMLRRIGAALNKKVEIRFVPIRRSA